MFWRNINVWLWFGLVPKEKVIFWLVLEVLFGAHSLGHGLSHTVVSLWYSSVGWYTQSQWITRPVNTTMWSWLRTEHDLVTWPCLWATRSRLCLVLIQISLSIVVKLFLGSRKLDLRLVIVSVCMPCITFSFKFSYLN